MINKFAKNTKLVKQAFSLIEIAIVVVVLSIIAFPMLEYLSTIDRVEKYKETREKIRSIQDAIANYYKTNSINSFPAPANISLAIDNVNVGKIAASQAHVTVNDTGQNVFYGAVPVSDLGLSMSYLVDAWGNKFSYYVTQIGTSSTSPGSLFSQYYDYNNNFVDTSLAFVIISHGEDGYGAFDKEGNQNSYVKASVKERYNIFDLSSPQAINSSNPLQISTGSLGDISYGQKKEEVLINYAGNTSLDLLKRFNDNITISRNSSAVGIGTQNPKSALTVAAPIPSNVSAQQAVHVGVLDNSNAGMELVSNMTNGGWIDFGHLNTGNTDFIGRIRYVNNLNQFIFSTNTREQMWLNNSGSGRLGIGNPNPWQALDVNGWIHPYENYGIRWKDDYYGGSGDTAYIQFIEEEGNNSKLRIANNNDPNDDIYFYQYGNKRLIFENGKIYIYAPIESNSSIFSKNSYMGKFNNQSDNNLAHFSHKTLLGQNDYLLVQNQYGDAYLNAANSKHLYFSVANDTKFYVHSNGVRFMDNVFFHVTNHGDGYMIRKNGQLEFWFDDWLRIYDTNNRNIAIGFDVNTQYTYANSFNYLSDVRFKTNIRDAESILNKYMKLEAKIYDNKKNGYLWNEKFKHKNYNIKGLIAQDLNKLFPEATSQDDDGYYYIKYDKINFLSVKALQEINQEKDSEIKKLELLIDKIERKIKKWEKR